MALTAEAIFIERAPDADGLQTRGLFLALQRLNRRIEQAVAAMQSVYGPEAANDPYRGLYIDHDEVSRLLTDEPGAARFQHGSDAEPLSAAGAWPRLARLQRAFGLSSVDADMLLIALAPELNPSYERLYAYLQNDVTRRRPSVNLALNLLYASFESKLVARQRFAPSAPLFKYQLLRLVDDPADHQPPLLSKYLTIDERVINFLLGAEDLDARLAGYAQPTAPHDRIDDLLLPADVKRRLVRLTRRHGAGAAGLIFYFQGPYGAGKQTTAGALCRELGVGLLAIDGERLAQADGATFEATLRLALRETLLRGAACYLDGFDTFLADDRRQQRALLIGELASHPGLIFLAGNTTWEPSDAPPGLSFVRIEFPRFTYAERLQLWALAIGSEPSAIAASPESPAAHELGSAAAQDRRAATDQGSQTMDAPRSLNLAVIAGKFRFSAGQIRDAAATARGLARWRDPDRRQVEMADLEAACRLQSNRKLATLARKITPHYTWDAIVLPADRIRQLREICNYVQYRALVYDTWGFDRKLSLGKGLNVLFAGPSGTGKTMAAEIMASELGLDLYKIDLSTVVSKYIGETEKNLARIFQEAETSNAILFFDEADALFGKRSEVRDSHDRYANLEIAYLLQRMEEYEGVVILATNLRKNMDDAFVRRMHVTVEFPFPGEPDRRRIWEAIWPAELPRAPALDLDFLARRFEIAGGNIRNVALTAAFLAAADGGVVTMGHLVRAMRREYQKMGKVVVDDEFGEYAGYVMGDG